MRAVISERGLRDIDADVLVAVVRSPSKRRLPVSLAKHLRPGAERLIAWRAEASTWLESHDLPTPRVLVHCLGPEPQTWDPDYEYLGGFAGSYDKDAAVLGLHRMLRNAGGLIERACNQAMIRHTALISWPEDCDITLLLEGMLLRAHNPRAWENEGEATASSVRRVSICVGDRQLDARTRKHMHARLREQLDITTATNFARTLADLPSNLGTASRLVERVRKRIADERLDLQLSTISAAEAAERGMGLFTGVDAGAQERGCILQLSHRGDDERPPLVLVGKGLTHDTGGYNLKRSATIHQLTHDKCGATAVIGAMLAIAKLDLQLPVIGLCPLTENNVDAHAYKPGDILTACNGTTVYIENTDAEGRLVLADVLAWITEHGPAPELLIDLATLTGEVHAVLGDPFAALFCNEDRARELLVAAGRVSGDMVWPLPIHDMHDANLGHHKADLRNIGTLSGSPASAAAFLRNFVDYPWAHIDLAGKSHAEYGRECYGPGATGFGVRLLVELARRMLTAD